MKKVNFYMFFLFFCTLILFTLSYANESIVSFQILNTENETYHLKDINSTFEIIIKTDIKHPYHLYAIDDTSGGVPLKYTILNNDMIEDYNVQYPNSKDAHLLGENLKTYEGTIYSTVSVKLKQINLPNIELLVKTQYQACTNTTCTQPNEKILKININNTQFKNKIPTSNNVIVNTDTSTSPLNNLTSNIGSNDNQTFYTIYKKNIFLAILLAFLWGIFSSLTPCVYPMIPITIAFFGNQSISGKTKKPILLAIIFTIGIALSFAILGATISLIGVDMGVVMTNPYIVIIVVLILLLFAGSMFELYEIRPPAFLMEKLGQSEQGYFGAFFMGLTLGLVAAPCVGPFAGSLLLFVSMIKSWLIGFIMLFFYGLGLGMLFILVAIGVNFLPKSGLWMIRLKYFFGTVLLWITLYFLQFITPLWLMLLLTSIYLIITAIIIGAYSTIDNQSLILLFFKGLGNVLLILASIFLILAFFSTNIGKNIINDIFSSERLIKENSNLTNLNNNNDWITDYEEGLKIAKLNKKPVIIDFYANWCLPCKQMENGIFKNKEFIKKSERFVKIKLDCTNIDSKGAIIKNQKYKSPYMPYVIFYDSLGNKVNDEIRGYTNLSDFLKIIEKIQ